MDVDTSPGLDGLTLHFIKYAFVPSDEPGQRPRNILLPCLTAWFIDLFHRRQVPSSWKTARISPLFKDGDPCDPDRYRMLAISGVLYRLFANTLRRLLTDWCQEAKAIPDTQFGFFPGRSTMHPLFVLRHLTNSAFASKKSVFTAFVDFTQAYDHIPRAALWHHLQHKVGLPLPVLAAIQSLYSEDHWMAGPVLTPLNLTRA
jgi:hypothetical protein